jgi:O-Antigen ligase
MTARLQPIRRADRAAGGYRATDGHRTAGGYRGAVDFPAEPPAGQQEDPGWPARSGGRVDGGRRRPARRWLASHPGWPITALLAGYPLWWALGVADFMWIILAVPMAARMLAWRRTGSRRIRVPSGFGIWLLFLIWMLAGIPMLLLTAPGTVDSAISHRLISFVIRAASYGGVTVLLLYAGNLTERELPRRKLAWLLGLVALYAIGGGVGGVIAPGFQFSSPTLLIIPHSLQTNVQIQASMHPGLAQVQNVFGTATGGAGGTGGQGRPKAPFDYTNAWGNSLTILLPWLIVAWSMAGTRRQRLISGAAMVIALVPLVYSLNRGVWIGVGLAACYLAVRMAARGKFGLLMAILAGIAVIGVAVLATPLQGVISQRLQNGKSNDLRATLSAVAIKDAMASPVLGYGDTRQEVGSPSSIAIGPTANCGSCGETPVGGNGQLWLLLICNGIVGAAVYLAFFAFGCWRYWRDTSPYGLAGVLILLLSFVYMFTYVAVVAPLGFTMLAYALLWRSDLARRRPAGQPPDAVAAPEDLADSAGLPA